MRKQEVTKSSQCQVKIQFFNGGLEIVKVYNLMLYNMTFHGIMAGFSFGALKFEASGPT